MRIVRWKCIHIYRKNFSVEYITLLELIEVEAPLSQQYLVSLIHPHFTNTNWDDSTILLEESVRYTEDLTTRILTGRLNLYNVSDAFMSKLLDYLCQQSLTFKTLVYPCFVALLHSMSEQVQHRIWWDFCVNESYISTQSGLELLHKLFYGKIMAYIQPCTLLTNNPSFLLQHLHEFIPNYTPVSHQLVSDLLERLILCDDRSMFEQYDEYTIQDISVVFRSLGEDMFNLYTLAVQHHPCVKTLWERENTFLR